MPVSTIDPTSALVVIDLQNGVAAIETAPHLASEVVERTTRLAEAFRASGRPVVLVRVTGTADDAVPGRTEVARAGGGARPEGWDQIVDVLAPLGDVTVTKRNWGAFYGTDLDLQLRRRGVTQVVLTGIATSIGVESTARAAHEHGYHVAVVTDAVADRSAEEHAHSVERIFPRLGETGTTDEVLALLS
jgi:nicotinamidase-related amidase